MMTSQMDFSEEKQRLFKKMIRTEEICTREKPGFYVENVQSKKQIKTVSIGKKIKGSTQSKLTFLEG